MRKNEDGDCGGESSIYVCVCSECGMSIEAVLGQIEAVWGLVSRLEHSSHLIQRKRGGRKLIAVVTLRCV